MNADLARYLDSTLLSADARRAQIEALAREAMELGCAAVCVNPVHVRAAVNVLRDSPVATASVAGFPLGASPILAKLAECRFAVEHGAREIDLVMPIWAALEGEWDVVEAEIAQVMEATPGVVRKVIVEIGLIGEERLAPLCAIMNRLRPEFVKTGTGYARPVTAADVGALRARLDAGIGIKAAGGIRTREQAERLIAAGATRIGTSQARTLLGAASG